MLYDGAFDLTDHACRTCLGPILRRGQVFMCAVCDAKAYAEPVSICGCGLRPHGVGQNEGHFRCVLNPARTPANPARVVIQFACTAVAADPLEVTPG